MTVDALKIQVINKFNSYLEKLELGYKYDYNDILNLILYIESCEHFNNIDKTYYYFLNND